MRQSDNNDPGDDDDMARFHLIDDTPARLYDNIAAGYDDDGRIYYVALCDDDDCPRLDHIDITRVDDSTDHDGSRNDDDGARHDDEHANDDDRGAQYNLIRATHDWIADHQHYGDIPPLDYGAIINASTNRVWK